MVDSNWIQKIYTDGACSGNPGPGGWGAVLYMNDGTVQELGGAEANTTNNRMELQGSIAALSAYQQTQQSQPIQLYTDSEYVRNGITKWISGWKKKGWKTSAGKPVLNQDLWEALDELNTKQVTWHYVKGHAGDPGNERADAIATSFAQGRPISLRQGEKVEVNSTLPVPSPQIQSAILEDAVKESRSTSNSLLPALLERLRLADEIASKGYLITTQELAELIEASTNAISDRGEEWAWRNWLVSRVRKEGNQILWQLERQGIEL
jgi:ribonuclease HI